MITRERGGGAQKEIEGGRKEAKRERGGREAGRERERDLGTKRERGEGSACYPSCDDGSTSHRYASGRIIPSGNAGLCKP